MVFALITRLVTGEAGLYLARLKRVAGLYALLCVFTLVTVLFLTIALFTWSAERYGGVRTALVFAAVFFLLAAVTFVLVTIAQRKPRERDEDRLQRDIASIAGVTALSSAPQLVRAMRQRKGLVVVPAAGAGFYALYRLLAALRRR